MNVLKTIILFFLIVFSTNNFAQFSRIEKLSNVNVALIVDSLENQLQSESVIHKNDILYELALYYYQIDQNQSALMAHNYIESTDTSKSSIQLNILYNLLATIHENNGNYDSVYHYLSIQDKFITNAQYEQNELLKDKLLSGILDKEEHVGILGISYMNFFILLGLIVLIIAIFVHSYLLKKKQLEIETLKNQELELANIKLQTYNNELQQAIMERTYEKAIDLEKSSNEIVELRKSLRKAEEANYLKNAFLGTMSHQIRTPLSGIMGFSDMLETELAIKGNEDLYEFAKNIQEAGVKLMGLITNIMDISSIEANILDLKIVGCDLNELVATVEKDSLIKAKDKGLIFKTKFGAGMPDVFADSENLIKSIHIVLDNAIQYTTKGFVTLSTSFNSDENSGTIEIKDKGSGIDEETLKMLNDSFDYAKHGSSLTYQGHGLGLILAHRLITLMNGSLVISSKEAIGTSVKITIPCSKNTVVKSEAKKNSKIKSDEKISKALIMSAPELGRLKIFVVEDDRMNRMVIEKMLKNTGEITLAVDGEDALKKIGKADAKKIYYDVMLLDMNLPAPWDGMKLMNEIRKRYSWTINTPFIAQTAYAMAGDKDLYIDAGFNDYISKPINKNELLTMIQKQLELFR